MSINGGSDNGGFKQWSILAYTKALKESVGIPNGLNVKPRVILVCAARIMIVINLDANISFE